MRQAGFEIPHVPMQKRFHLSYLLLTFALMGGKFLRLPQ